MAKGSRARPDRRNWVVRSWLRWRAWRRSRPFWGGLLMILGGAELAAVPLGPMDIGFAGVSLAGVPTFMLALFIIALGAITWFTPHQRMITGILGGLCALGSLVISNLGGLFIGALLVLFGSAATFSWQPGTRKKRSERRRARQPEDPSDDPGGPAEESTARLSELMTDDQPPATPPTSENGGAPTRQSPPGQHPSSRR